MWRARPDIFLGKHKPCIMTKEELAGVSRIGKITIVVLGCQKLEHCFIVFSLFNVVYIITFQL